LGVEEGMGDRLSLVLIVFYAVLLLVYVYEGHLWKALYWFGALCIVLSVWGMK
jgi:drug/metabolite transporter (DMT)-like permease